MAYAGASQHTNNTAEISGIIPLFPQVNRPVPGGSQAGTVQSRTNVCLGDDKTAVPFHRSSLRIRITPRQIYSHAGNVGNECADHPAALGALSFVCVTTMSAPSFNTTNLVNECNNLDEVRQCLCDPRRHPTPAQQPHARR